MKLLGVHNHLAVRLGAFALRAHTTVVSERDVNDLPLEARHRAHRHRAPASGDTVGGALGHLLYLLAATMSVA